MVFVAFTMHMSYLPPGPHVFGCGSSHPNFGAKGKSSRVVNQTNKGTTVVRYFLDNRVTSVWDLFVFIVVEGLTIPLARHKALSPLHVLGFRQELPPRQRHEKRGNWIMVIADFWPYDPMTSGTRKPWYVMICDSNDSQTKIEMVSDSEFTRPATKWHLLALKWLYVALILAPILALKWLCCSSTFINMKGSQGFRKGTLSGDGDLTLAMAGMTICYGYGWKILDKRQPVDSPPL